MCRRMGRSLVFLIFLISLAIYAILSHDIVTKINEDRGVSEEYVRKTKSEINSIKESIEKIRGLRLSKGIDIKFVNTRWAIENWAPKETEVAKELLFRELFFKATFIINWNESTISLGKEWVGMFAAATSGYTLYINTDYFDPGTKYARNVIAHELTHILQFENFHINWPECTDARKALSALVEGDAGLVQRLYCTSTGKCEPSEPWSVNFNNLYLSLNAFPYIYGERLVLYLYERGGWELVNLAYSKPPVSTKMVMFPEIYAEYLLSNITYPTCGYKDPEAELSDTMGAYFLYLFASKIADAYTAIEIARSWRGDALRVSGDVGDALIEWSVDFEDKTWARTFYLSLMNYLAENMGSALPLNESEPRFLYEDANYVATYLLRSENGTTVKIIVEVKPKG